MIRNARFSGSWYDGNESALRMTLHNFFTNDERGPKKSPIINEKGPRKIVAIISPHAGYIYSGAIAAHGFVEVALDGRPNTFIIVGIDHRGLGAAPASIQIEGGWKTPFGIIDINNEIAQRILSSSEKISNSPRAHEAEHSLELQVPFIQYIYGNQVKIVPVMISSGSLSVFKDVGNAIANGCNNENVVLIASTDFTHFESADDAEAQDQLAIDAILKLDEDLLYDTVKKNRISMCGYGSTSVVINAAKKLGANKATLLKYGNSGEVSGDYNQVVGYGSLKLEK
ncbi:MAG: AmmeMemoRadiSam system protein B [Candidatus Helarchaeota archaeon]